MSTATSTRCRTVHASVSLSFFCFCFYFCLSSSLLPCLLDLDHLGADGIRINIQHRKQGRHRRKQKSSSFGRSPLLLRKKLESASVQMEQEIERLHRGASNIFGPPSGIISGGSRGIRDKDNVGGGDAEKRLRFFFGRPDRQRVSERQMRMYEDVVVNVDRGGRSWDDYEPVVVRILLENRSGAGAGAGGDGASAAGGSSSSSPSHTIPNNSSSATALVPNGNANARLWAEGMAALGPVFYGPLRLPFRLHPRLVKLQVATQDQDQDLRHREQGVEEERCKTHSRSTAPPTSTAPSAAVSSVILTVDEDVTVVLPPSSPLMLTMRGDALAKRVDENFLLRFHAANDPLPPGLEQVLERKWGNSGDSSSPAATDCAIAMDYDRVLRIVEIETEEPRYEELREGIPKVRKTTAPTTA